MNISDARSNGVTPEKVKPYACDRCDYRGAQRTHLVRHILTHTGERPYKCDLCSYASTTSSNLSTHRHIHTDYRPYACGGDCPFRSTTAHTLKIHRKPQFAVFVDEPMNFQRMSGCGSKRAVDACTAAIHAGICRALREP